MEQNKHNYKLIALDIDGTLLGSDHQVSSANRKAISRAREKGIEVILSTGRHYMTCSKIAKSLDLSSYLVTVNGSEIWTTSGELVERQLIDVEIIKILVELQKKHKAWAWMASTDEVFRGEIPEDLGAHDWLKFGFDLPNEKVRDTILEELSKEERIELSNSSPTNIEINAEGINKARAVEKVCGELGITMDQVITMGDSLNDIKMIEEAGLGIAMGNAQEEVKKAADWITGKNDEDGVAQAINHWVL